jgi:bifunctional N-acetylglucosamine-1-phosphate-uridyltransferase/glucosamine-1-phosphate-acetyltransferase GlmU-like protein
MAAPNIVSPTSLYGKTAAGTLTTSATAILSNASASGKLLKVNSLYVANVDGTNAADATISQYSQAAVAGTATAIASTIPVLADNTLVVIDKDAPLYLEENMSLGGLASANGDLVWVVSYEEYA